MGRASMPPCRIYPGDVIWLDDLEACRPAPVSEEWKAAVLRSLPPEGEVTNVGAAQRRKLESLAPVLQPHDRDGVFEIKAIDVPQAWTGLHERAVLLISLPALRMLSSEELKAIIAHEIGHEYFWEDYREARDRGELDRLRTLEAACDTVAVLTLQSLRVKPEQLIGALEKVLVFNRRRFGIARNERSYPDLEERRALVKRLATGLGN